MQPKTIEDEQEGKDPLEFQPCGRVSEAYG